MPCVAIMLLATCANNQKLILKFIQEVVTFINLFFNIFFLTYLFNIAHLMYPNKFYSFLWSRYTLKWLRCIFCRWNIYSKYACNRKIEFKHYLTSSWIIMLFEQTIFTRLFSNVKWIFLLIYRFTWNPPETNYSRIYFLSFWVNLPKQIKII